VTDWREWHEEYGDPGSSLSRRLRVVQGRLDELLSTGSVHQVLSLCAGDGRDIIPALARCAAEDRPSAVLVELDPVLAATAERHAAEAGVTIRVVVGDAGRPESWGTVPPVDLLMLCGIFGNISDDDILCTIRAAPGLLAAGGAVIWTRGAFGDRDLRPQIRRWFEEAGFDEIAFDHEERGYGVGVHRLSSAARPTPPPRRLFSFVR
jgi:hypothetical protein